MFYSITANGKLLDLNNPVIMGIINATPDSFYTRSLSATLPDLQKRIEEMIAQGAHIIDIGGVSTRPFAEEVTEAEELSRLMPILQWTRKAFPDTFISIDTYRAGIVSAVYNEGADIINDISGGTFDPEMLRAVARSSLPYVAMHIQGNPSNMQLAPRYENLLVEILDYFIILKNELNTMGIHQVIIDPGFGFGKNTEHNYKLLKDLRIFTQLGYPILAGLSRKGMIWKTIEKTAGTSLGGTIAANMIALLNGAHILRVHDVQEAADTIKIYKQYISV